ncbi:MAG: DUF370 domain-containing protein [Eubacteriales bacterium]|nr:DUF370 domain-containing protein [Eubacteriales bacterium]
MKMLNIGFGNSVAAGRVISVIAPDAAPTRRMVQDARDSKTLVDATSGRRTRAVIIMDSGHIVLSGLQPETLTSRMQEDKGDKI